MIARLTVQRGALTEYPLAEKVSDGWQNGVTFYPDGDVTDYQELTVTPIQSCCLCCIAAAERGELDHTVGQCNYPPCDWHTTDQSVTDGES